MLHLSVVSRFWFGGPSGGDDPDAVVPFAITMAHDEQPQAKTEAKQDETILCVRVIRVWEDFCSFVCESRLRFVEVDAMLLEIRGGFSRIPFESKFAHGEMITTM
jgi:hypothetical protein